MRSDVCALDSPNNAMAKTAIMERKLIFMGTKIVIDFVMRVIALIHDASG